MTPSEALRSAQTERDVVQRRIAALLTSDRPVTPQVAGRRINDILKIQLRVFAAHLADRADPFDGVSPLTEDEREHLRFAARYLGYEYPSDPGSAL